MDKPDVKTFNVADMFAGISYPREVVSVYMDPNVSYEMYRLTQEALEAVKTGEEAKGKAVEKKLAQLKKDAAATRYEFHLVGQSRDNRKALVDALLAEFPQVTDFLDRPKPNPAADEAYANRTWALHIEKIVRPDGAVIVAPSEDEVAIIRGNAPDPARDAIEAGIQKLTSGVKSGFEALVQDHDFL